MYDGVALCAAFLALRRFFVFHPFNSARGAGDCRSLDERGATAATRGRTQIMTTDPKISGISMLSSGATGASRRGTPMPAMKWKTRVLLPAGVIAAAAGLLVYTGAEALTPALDVEVVPVVLKAAKQDAAPSQETKGAPATGTGAVAAQAPGWIEPDPFAINVSSLANGVVREVLVLEGDRVTAGQLLARLIDDDARLELVRAEAESREKMAEVVVAEAEMMEARMVWENRIDLIRAVAVAEATLEEARAELARLPLEVDAQAAKLEELRDDLRRKEELVLKRAVPEADVVQLRHRVKAQEAALDAARAMRPVLEAKVKVWQAEAVAARDDQRLRIRDTRMMAAANANHEAAKAASARADAMREEARLRMARMDIRSPAAGVVMRRLVEPGSKLMMEMDDPSSCWVVRLYDPKKLQVRVDVPLVSAGSLGVGMPAEITVEALPGRTFTGKVTRLVHEANIQKNTVQVKVVIDEPVPELKPEMLTRVKLFSAGGTKPAQPRATGTTPGSGVIMAPTALLMREGGEATARAWVVDQSRSRAQPRDVRLGALTERATDGGDWIEVVEGLRPGDRLIAGDISRLRDGLKVRVSGEKGEDFNGVH